MDKFIEISLLCDFYGELLSQRQKSIIEYYYNDNYSLGEIAEQLSISRQGVYDTLKRGEELLYRYDKKLNLREKYHSTNNTIHAAIEKIQLTIDQIPKEQKALLTLLTQAELDLKKALKQI